MSTMRGAAYVNGTISTADAAVIPVFDHGFMYGEGVYEVLRAYSGVPFLFDRHLARLRRSAAHLHLEVPFDDDTLKSWVEQTVAAFESDEAVIDGRHEPSVHREVEAGGASGQERADLYIRILLTRGIGDLTYDVRATPSPSTVIIVKPLETAPSRIRAEGIGISLVPILRNHPGSVNPIIKSNNLLNNALALQEAHRRGCEEAVMCNYRGELSECSQSNLFVVRDGIALTPPSDAGLLEGITRAFLLEIGPEIGIDVRDTVLWPADLETADEVFISSTTREISPVVRIDDRIVGTGRPGEITLRLWDAYHERALRSAADAFSASALAKG